MIHCVTLYQHEAEFIEALVRKTFPSENAIINAVIHSAITNLTDHIKLIVTIKLRLDFAKYRNRFTNSFQSIQAMNL